MEPIVEIKNRSIFINTAQQKEDYCKTAQLFYVLDGRVRFLFDGREAELKRTDLLVLNRGTGDRPMNCVNLNVVNLSQPASKQSSN